MAGRVKKLVSGVISVRCRPIQFLCISAHVTGMISIKRVVMDSSQGSCQNGGKADSGLVHFCAQATGYLKLLPHSVGVAYRGSSLVCYSVTYLEYKSACRVVYAIPLSHLSDIRELAMDFLFIYRELYFKSYA